MSAQIEEAIRIAYAEPVRRAFALIKPKAEWRDACRYDVETALIEIKFIIGQLRANSYPRTKLAKLAARRLVRALRHVETVLKDKNLDFSIKKFFPRTELLKWAVRCKGLVETPSGKLKRTNAEAKRLAVREANSLMRDYGEPGAARDTTKGSTFCRLAALLYGDPKADLHNQCRAALRKKRGSK
jgi:hypothetical protein